MLHWSFWTPKSIDLPSLRAPIDQQNLNFWPHPLSAPQLPAMRGFVAMGLAKDSQMTKAPTIPLAWPTTPTKARYCWIRYPLYWRTIWFRQFLAASDSWSLLSTPANFALWLGWDIPLPRNHQPKTSQLGLICIVGLAEIWIDSCPRCWTSTRLSIHIYTIWFTICVVLFCAHWKQNTWVYHYIMVYLSIQ